MDLLIWRAKFGTNIYAFVSNRGFRVRYFI